MSIFDLDKLMAALSAPVTETENAIRVRANEVLTDTQERLTKALKAEENDLKVQSAAALEEDAQRNQEALKALENTQGLLH